jgi:hypothetical protein
MRERTRRATIIVETGLAVHRDVAGSTDLIEAPTTAELTLRHGTS